ncbi:dipeptidase [Pseudoglutamicibacter albus]|uniref:dipeptidase n=1 Tax=Pseudoglutamicibacter albus TaxID=98671 RepID=UPI001EF7205E|nr:dipeptidase [Pseudoglutamicibacter albus]MCG7304180.1 dipeptidase [Pseudoglutamicibacter albus]
MTETNEPLSVVSPDVVDQLRSAVDGQREQLIKELSALVEIPSVAWDDLDPQPVIDSAEAVAELFRSAGLEDVRVLSAARPDGAQGRPAIIARREAADGMPTVLMYAHHDVQPTGDVELWNTDPWKATEVNGRLYGRGTADDKAGIMVHVGALRAIDQVAAATGLGLTYFIEGEEEVGSPSFANFLQENRDALAAEVIIVADSSNWKVGQPALTTSLRGLTAGEFEVRALEHAVHSGVFGGPVLDAPTIAARLVATLHDENGDVAVEGLAVASTAEIDYDEADFRADANVVEGLRLAGTGSIADRLWRKPAISLIGMDITNVSLSSNTIIPMVRGKVSVRLAPGQDPALAAKAMEEHFANQDIFGAEISYKTTEVGPSFATDTSSPAAQAKMWALEQAWNVKPVEMGLGGSIPFIGDLQAVFPDAEILVTGIEDPDTRAHSANESLHIEDFFKATLSEALLLTHLATEAANS